MAGSAEARLRDQQRAARVSTGLRRGRAAVRKAVVAEHHVDARPVLTGRLAALAVRFNSRIRSGRGEGAQNQPSAWRAPACSTPASRPARLTW